MPEILNSNLVRALLADDDYSNGLGSIPGLLLFMVALIVVAACMAISAGKRSWESAALTLFIWLCAGLFVRPWTFFTNASPLVQNDSYWAPCWKIAAFIWGMSLLLCLVVTILIYLRKRSRHRRHRHRSAHRWGEDKDPPKRDHDSYEV